MNEKKKNRVKYLGHGSFRIETAGGSVIYIDPGFPVDDYQLPADLILVSHHHGDHNRVDVVNKKSNCQIWDYRDFIVEGEYKQKEFSGVSIISVEAYNTNHKKEECIGFVIKLADGTIYIAGDTSKTAMMAKMVCTRSTMPFCR